MNQRISFSLEETMPPDIMILRARDLPERDELPARVAGLLDTAEQIFRKLAEPRGAMAEVSREEFDEIFSGVGLNAHEAPLSGIFPQATGLALFAATLGAPVSAEISRLFAHNDPALGYMLDAVSSAAADRLADLMGERFRDRIAGREESAEAGAVLAYSPGYCGWHITAQRRLFAFLRPESIGITLSESCLMQPLKSVSGVLVAGPASLHRFRPVFSFCADCRTHECVDRMRAADRQQANLERRWKS